MKKFIKRAFCMHINWKEGRILGQTPHHNDYALVYGEGRLIPWTCCQCGKVNHFKEIDPPIQYLGN